MVPKPLPEKTTALSHVLTRTLTCHFSHHTMSFVSNSLKLHFRRSQELSTQSELERFYEEKSAKMSLDGQRWQRFKDLQL